MSLRYHLHRLAAALRPPVHCDRCNSATSHVWSTGGFIYFCLGSCAHGATQDGDLHRGPRTHIVRGARTAWRIAGKVDPVSGEDA